MDGSLIHEMSEEKLAAWRGRNVGIVFQFFQLLPTLTALENAMLPLDFARLGSKSERRRRATEDLELVGLGTSLAICRLSCLGASSSASRLHARWRQTRSS